MTGRPPGDTGIVDADDDGVTQDAVVASVLASGAPGLLDLPRRVVAEGWDNLLVRLGDDLVLRLPRRARTAELVATEQRWLPVLAPSLPVAVPVPVVAGRPGPDFPWPWSVLAWREGEVAGSRPRSRATAWVPDLAAALAALHRPAPAEAPHNPVRAVPLAARDRVVRERLERGRLRGLDVSAALEVWARGVAAPAWGSAPVWVHGDPHPNNLLVRPGPDDGPDRLDALLDWGDLSAGDPACDLAAAWLVPDRVGRTVFVAAYDDLVGARADGHADDPGRWDRAAAWAVSMASSVVVDAPDDAANRRWADATLREIAERSLG